MSTQHLDQLKRVMPPRMWFRGPNLWALLWSVGAMVAFTGLLLIAFLVVGLLDTRGLVFLQPSQIDEYESVVGAQVLSDAVPAEDRANTVFLANQGLRGVGWELRNRPLGPAIASLPLRFPILVDTGSALLYLIAVGLLLGMLYSASMAQVQSLAARSAGKTVGQLRESIHRHALRTGPEDLKNQSTGHVLDLFTSEIELLREGLEDQIVSLFRSPLRLLVLAILALVIHWQAAFECAVPLLFCWYLIRREHRHTERDQWLCTDRASSELQLLAEGISRGRLIRGYQLDDFEHSRFQRHLGRYQQQLADSESRMTRTRWLSRMLVLVCFGIVLFLAGVKLLADPVSDQHLSLTEGVLLLACFAFSWHPLKELVDLPRRRHVASGAADRIYRFLNSIPEVGQAVGAKFLQPVQKAVQFEAVTWKLDGEKLLDGLDLKIPSGGSSAVVAFDPLEAQALVALIPRFIEPHEGRVLIDSENTAFVTLESLRTEVLVVGGNDSCFTGTVLENIGCGDSKFTLSQATEAAKRAHAHNFIQRFAQGYETAIGQHGEQLTPSQEFRLSLARALLRDPALLIIEEPDGTMSDDEKALMDDACNNARQDRTVIFLPRRMSTLRSVDRIILLNRGRVEVVGTHEVLLKSSALYRHWEYLHFNEFRRDTSSPAE